MGTLQERFETDYKTALKAKEQLRVDTLRLIKAAIERTAFEKRKETLEDQDILPLLSQQVKQRRETLEAAKQAGRHDVITQSEAELAILHGYLPQPLSEDALKQLIEEAIKTAGPNQGQIMKFVMGKAAGAADGKLVSQLVAQRLKPST